MKFALDLMDQGESYGVIAARWNASNPGDSHDVETVRKAVARSRKK